MDELEPLDQEIVALAGDGRGARRIALELGLTRYQVEKALRRLGLLGDGAPRGRRDRASRGPGG